MFKTDVKYAGRILNFEYLPRGLGLDNQLSFNQKKAYFKKSKVHSLSLKESLQDFKINNNKTVVEQLLAEILYGKYSNFTFVTTERKAIHFLVRALVAHNIRPDIVVKGSQTVLLMLPSFGIKFVCLDQFISGSPGELRDTFGISNRLSYLPNIDPLTHWSTLEKKLAASQAETSAPTSSQELGDQCNNYASEMPAPQFEKFIDVMDTKEIISKKREFWEEIRNQPFNYLKSLEAVNVSELDIYTLAGLHFVRTSMDFQRQCLLNFSRPPHFKNDSLPVVPAFNFASTSSFLKSTFRTFALPDKTLFTVVGENGKKKPISKLEHEAVEYLRYKQPNQWVTCYSSSKGQQKFYLPDKKREFMIADAFNPSKKMCFLFCGCYYHAHPNCHLLKGKSVNFDKYDKLKQQILQLLFYCADKVSSVALLWECEYRQLKKPRFDRSDIFAGRTLIAPFEDLKGANTDLLDFLSGPLFRPFQGMVLRDALRPATCECYALKYVKKEGDGNICHILDIASLFPYVAINYPMPCGKYYKLAGDELHCVDFDTQFTTIRHKGKDVLAIVHCRVHPPTNLQHPFLQTKVNDITVGTLCRTCSEKPRRSEGRTFCQHSKMERSFVGTYTSQELAYGMSLGYHYDLFEMAVYPESGFFLAKFLTLLGYYKLRYCEWPNDLAESERADYCQDLSKRMRFKEILGLELTPDTVSPNQKMREVYKTFLNHFLGTFGTNQDKFLEVQFLDSYQQLLAHLKNDRIVDLEPMTDSILRVTLSTQHGKPSRSSNVSVSCAVTSIARIIVHQHLQKLVSLNATILRVSCDSIYFVMKDTEPIPFELSEAFGCFKKVYCHVEGVAQVGVQLVSVLFRDKHGSLKEKVVASGATMSAENSSVLSHQQFEDTAEKLIHSSAFNFSTLKVTSLRNSCKRHKQSRVEIKQRALFSRNLFSRRQLINCKPYYMTLPYGYNGGSM